MKKILNFAAMAMLVLASCTKVSDGIATIGSSQEINFQTAYYSLGTKADDVDGYSELDTEFIVRAYYTDAYHWNDIDIATADLYMEDVEISKQEEEGNIVWKATEGTYFWPKTGTLTFFGYTGWEGTPVWGNDKTALFSSEETIKANSDPMVSDIASSYGYPGEGSVTYFTKGVPMLFHHTTSKVAFMAKIKYDKAPHGPYRYVVVINYLSIDDMYTKGTYTLNATNTKITGNWSNRGGVNSLEYFAPEGDGQTLTTTADNLGEAGQVSVLPQSVASLKAFVDYDVYVYKSSSGLDKKLISVSNFSNEVSLATENIKEWEQNKIYTYTLTISPVGDEITFDPAASNWKTVSSISIED